MQQNKWLIFNLYCQSNDLNVTIIQPPGKRVIGGG
jgi:hypothetical protein